ncbi:MAG TPA: class I SAM-dependent methyltransferase [Acidiferrobacterales bacterium]
MDPKSHWQKIYTRKPATDVSWYRAHLDNSLTLIRATGVNGDEAIIDVGCGASTLVDDLLDAGYRNLSVLDVSSSALACARERLGGRAARVDWREADIARATLPRHRYSVWHDRAVFHFLTREEDRARYVGTVRHAVKPGGHVIVATFGPDGPVRCSGLDIVRYDPDSLHSEFGPSFELVEHLVETHVTPVGNSQQFVYCYCRVR